MNKNQYEISQNYLLKLENEELRDRIKELIEKIKSLEISISIKELEINEYKSRLDYAKSTTSEGDNAVI